MNYDTMTRGELIEALEPIGAGGVSVQRITQPCPSDLPLAAGGFETYRYRKD